MEYHKLVLFFSLLSSLSVFLQNNAYENMNIHDNESISATEYGFVSDENSNKMKSEPVNLNSEIRNTKVPDNNRSDVKTEQHNN